MVRRNARLNEQFEPEELITALEHLGFAFSDSQRRDLEAGYTYQADDREKVLAFRPSEFLKDAAHGGSAPLNSTEIERKLAASLDEIEPLYLKAVAVVRFHRTLEKHRDRIDKRVHDILGQGVRTVFFRTIRTALGRERVNLALLNLRVEYVSTLSSEEAKHIERLVIDTDSDEAQRATLKHLLKQIEDGVPVLELNPAIAEDPPPSGSLISVPFRLRENSLTRTGLGVPSESQDPQRGYSDAEEHEWQGLLGRLTEADRQPAIAALNHALGVGDQLQPYWRDERGRVRITLLLERLADLTEKAEQAKLVNLSSPNAHNYDKIGGRFSSITPERLSDYESPADILDAVERQELEKALAQIRNPTSAAELAEASSLVRWHVSRRLAHPSEGPSSPVHVIRSFVAELRQLTDQLTISPDSGNHELSAEQLGEQQEQLFALRTALDQAVAATQARIQTVAEAMARREKGFTIVGTSKLKRGLELIETLRAEGKSCIVVRRGARKERALLIPYQDGMAYDAEVPSNLFYVGGRELVTRAFAGERILIKDGHSQAPIALIAPLTDAAEIHWKNTQEVISRVSK